MKRALITGISGQDGAYLAKYLLGLGYEVWGTSRDAQVASFRNLSLSTHVRNYGDVFRQTAGASYQIPSPIHS